MDVEVAAYGWLSKDWAPSYPDDMPGEWRLDYYANYHRAVVVPRRDWLSQEKETLQTWLEEAPEEHLFYWEVAGDAEAGDLLRLYQTFREAVVPGGWLLSGAAKPVREYRELAELAPIAVCHSVGECQGEAFRTLRVAQGESLLEVRQRMDACAREGSKQLLLVVMPSPGAAQQMQQLQTLCELYGG